jgi:hypothetical protein
MAYATRHPTHPDKLILISTEAAGGTHKERRVAMFEKLGGPEVGAMARRRMFEGHRDKANAVVPGHTRRRIGSDPRIHSGAAGLRC